LSKVRIVTDSTADIPLEIREKLGIEMVSLKVSFGKDTYIDGVSLTPEEFYDKLVAAPTLPITSQPSPVDFQQKYESLASEDGEKVEIISIHLSSVMSGTYQSAVLAKAMIEDDGNDRISVTVVDSKSASYGIGVQVLAAAEAANAGKSKEEILELIEKARKECEIYFLVDTLDYLHKGGRLGRASAMIGSLLNIKPILTIDNDGYVAPIDKVRGQKKAMARIVELMKERGSSKAIHLKLAHVRNPEGAETLKQMIAAEYDIVSCMDWTIGAVIGTYTGPGIVAVFISPA